MRLIRTGYAGLVAVALAIGTAVAQTERAPDNAALLKRLDEQDRRIGELERRLEAQAGSSQPAVASTPPSSTAPAAAVPVAPVAGRSLATSASSMTGAAPGVPGIATAGPAGYSLQTADGAGEVAGGVFSYAFGGFDGTTDGASTDASPNPDVHNDSGRLAWEGRVFTRPFGHSDNFFLKGFGVGIGGTRSDTAGSPGSAAAGAVAAVTANSLLPSYRPSGQQVFFSYRGVRRPHSPTVSRPAGRRSSTTTRAASGVWAST